MTGNLIEWSEFTNAYRELGDAFPRILQYYREDGFRSVDAVERAMDAGDAAALVIPAHTLKGESRQFGAKAMGDISETIEMAARDCVEFHRPPTAIRTEVELYRICFTRTLVAIEEAMAKMGTPVATPPAFGRRPGGFGRKVVQPGFGRAQ